MTARRRTAEAALDPVAQWYTSPGRLRKQRRGLVLLMAPPRPRSGSSVSALARQGYVGHRPLPTPL
jgi:hypothetical protein